MLLDKDTAAVGTRGWIPPATGDQFSTAEDINFFIEDYVELRPDGTWAFPLHMSNGTQEWEHWPSNTHVYSDWREAIEHTLRSEAKSAIEQIDEAVKNLAITYRVSDLVRNHKEP